MTKLRNVSSLGKYVINQLIVYYLNFKCTNVAPGTFSLSIKFTIPIYDSCFAINDQPRFIPSNFFIIPFIQDDFLTQKFEISSRNEFWIIIKYIGSVNDLRTCNEIPGLLDMSSREFVLIDELNKFANKQLHAPFFFSSCNVILWSIMDDDWQKVTRTEAKIKNVICRHLDCFIISIFYMKKKNKVSSGWELHFGLILPLYISH